MFKAVRIANLGFALALAGCSTTELAVKPLAATDPERIGAGYVLPFTQYAVTMTWRLAECSAATGPKIASKVEATIGSADDGAHAYIIDPTSLQTLRSITALKAAWHDNSNMLSAINASVEDRSAQIIGNVVTSVAKLATLAVAPGAPAGAKLACTGSASKQLDAAKAAKAKLDGINDQVELANADVVRLAAKVAAMGGAVDQKTKDSYSRALNRLDDLKAQQAEAAEALAGALKPISSVQRHYWPRTGDEFRSKAFDIKSEDVERWVTVPDALADPIYLAIERSGSYGRQSDDGYVPPSASIKGIRYRTPVAGRFVACTVTPCESTGVGTVLTVVEGPVAQLGYVNVLNIKARPFGSSTFAAEFNPAGGLKSMGYEQKTAPAESASGAAVPAIEALSPLLNPTERLKTQTLYLKALQEKRDAAAKLSPEPSDPTAEAVAVLDADTSLLQAQISNLQAQITLKDLQMKLQK